MSLQCTKCANSFKSFYLLTRHLNKKIPCGDFLQCSICMKQFINTHHYTNHKNKKNPCRIPTNLIINNTINIELRKIELEEKKLNQQKEIEQLKLDLERDKLAQQKEIEEKKIQLAKEKILVRKEEMSTYKILSFQKCENHLAVIDARNINKIKRKSEHTIKSSDARKSKKSKTAVFEVSYVIFFTDRTASKRLSE